MAPPEVIAWYERKTAQVLAKYGPGPRVHFHTGLVPGGVTAGATLERLRAQLVASQEEMLHRGARVWTAEETLRGREILDVGCGLGGPAIFWAQEYGATVTALSPVAMHLPIVERFAAEAGVAARVRTLLGDACDVEGPVRFDTVFTSGASNYFDRARWFRALRNVLRHGGSVLIEDTFVEDPAMKAPFDAYFLSRIGTLDEYVQAAHAAGFRLDINEDVTREAAAFWVLSARHSEELLIGRLVDGAEADARDRSIRWHAEMERAYRTHALSNRLLRFTRVD